LPTRSAKVEWWDAPRLTFVKVAVDNANVKDEARRLIDRLPEQATWDDLMYEIYVRQAIEAGIRESDADLVTDNEAVRKSFGLTPSVT
jgi:hypothetical protein